MKFYVLFVLSLISFNRIDGYKILFLVPFPGSSHWLNLQSFAKELLNRGHEVTSIVNNPITNFTSSNYTEVLIFPPFDRSKLLPQQDALAITDETDFEKIRAYDSFVRNTSEYGLKTPNVQKIIHSKDLHFDLIINADFFHESWLMFAHKFNAPIVSICPYGYPDFADRAMGFLTPWSFVPHFLLPYGDDMNYIERIYNVILSLYDWWFRSWVMLERQNEIAHRYFAHLAEPGNPLPHVADLYRNISLILVNTHISISKPRPKMPGIVYYGGAHIKPSKPLPHSLQEFLDTAEDGVIYFSLGTHLQSSMLPKEKMDAFISVFNTLKQRIIWKFEDESYEVPANVLIGKWFSQSDILAHPNVKVFITHGGISGTHEGMNSTSRYRNIQSDWMFFTQFKLSTLLGTARGVPMLFIPFFADQRRNALRTEQNGNGLMLSFSKLTTKTLSAALNKILTNKAYFDRAKEVARLFNDNLVHPMDESIYWIEYVMRSKGAKHLKSYAINMSWFSTLLLDVLILPIVFVGFIYIGLKLSLRFVRSKLNDECIKITYGKSKRA